MRMLILGLILVVGMGGLAAGQSTPARQRMVTYGPSTKVVADELRYDADRHTTYARGAVRIVSESSTIHSR